MTTPQNADDGVEPLHIACRIGHLDAVRQLLTQGADLSTRLKVRPTMRRTRQDGRSPLLIASGNNYPAVVAELVRFGADVDDTQTVRRVESFHSPRTA